MSKSTPTRPSDVDQVAQAALEPSKDLYNAACFLSRCVPVVEKDSKLPDKQRHERAKEYSDRALTALRQAIQKGYKDSKNIREDKDLAPVRDREDFKKLLAELEKEKPATK